MITSIVFGASLTLKANQCVDLVRQNQSQNSPIMLGQSISTYRELKSSRMWNHSQRDFHNALVQRFILETTEKSADILFQIMIELNESDKISLLEEALDILKSANPDVSRFNQIFESLKNKYDVILDFKLDNSPRLTRLVLNSQVSVKTVSALERLIGSLYDEKPLLFELFERVAQNSDPSIKTESFVDPSREALGVPKPVLVPLLVYTIRQNYFELFKLLVKSPQIYKKLHLDYSVALLDETLLIPTELERRPYRYLINQTFTPEARMLYESGSRGSDGSTFWNKIPLKAY